MDGIQACRDLFVNGIPRGFWHVPSVTFPIKTTGESLIDANLTLKLMCGNNMHFNLIPLLFKAGDQ